jgi:hypothetical protein
LLQANVEPAASIDVYANYQADTQSRIENGGLSGYRRDFEFAMASYFSMRAHAAVIALLATFAIGTPLWAAEAPARGASLLIRLLSDDRVPLAKAEVEVVPADSRPRPGSPPQPATVLGRGTTDEKGWVTIEKLPPSAVALQIRPDGRKQPYISEPIELRDGERVVVDDVVVSSPSELVIHLDLTDSIREHLAAERIKTIKVIASSPRAKTLSVDTKEPMVTFEEALPGKWTVRPLLVMGGSTYVVDPPQGIEVEVPAGTRIDLTVPVRGLVFAGRVTVAGEPVRGHGQMNLRPSEPNSGDWGFAVPFDNEGRFAFPLPRAGKRDLIVASRKISTMVPGFHFREADARGEMEIELPEGVIAGRVVDIDGNAVPSVRVSASLEHEGKDRPVTAGTVSDDKGEFEIQGLVGGRWTVAASNPKASSEPLQVSLLSDSRTEGVLLRLTRQKLQMRVVTNGGDPVRAALVTVSVLPPDQSQTRSARALTDRDGLAGIDLSIRNGAPLMILVEPGAFQPGTRTSVLTFRQPAAEEVTITAAPPDATIRFARVELQDPRVLVREDGSFLALGEWQGRLRYARTEQPAEIGVRSGTWQIVIADTPLERQQLYLGLGFSLPAARRFQVPPGATVHID